MSSTFPNRVFQHAAQTDRLDNSLSLSTLPTIWDRLLSAGVSCKYYYSNVPFLALWGLNYIGISALYADFLTDAANGTLPSVSFVDPWFTILDDGSGNDDHPHADLRKGEIFLRQIVEALAKGPDWSKTVLIINRDEWGGFFDHVVPPRAAAPNHVDTDIVDGKTLLGCRVPVLIVSPFSKGNAAKPRINSLTYDHTSVLKLIEWRWQLQPLTARDASHDIANLALALDFSNQDISLPALPIIKNPPWEPCFNDFSFAVGQEAAPATSDRAMALALKQHAKGVDNETYDFYLLLKSEHTNGWRVPAGLK
jgi:phospholipase C